jgi:predicted protein tyrosine phosphatase
VRLCRHRANARRPPCALTRQSRRTPKGDRAPSALLFLCAAHLYARLHLKRLLFICSRNKLRSPTAEQVFATWSNVEVASAGLAADAETPVTPDLVEWADIIFVMEKAHRTKLTGKFRQSLNGQRIICLNVPDRYDFMEPELVRLFTERVPKFLEKNGAI